MPSRNGFVNIECFINPIKAYSEICNRSFNFKYSVVFAEQDLPNIKGEDLLYHFQSVIQINGAVITAEKNSVNSNKYPVFEKSSPEFFFEIVDLLKRMSKT